jgi:hypothetical protein
MIWLPSEDSLMSDNKSWDAMALPVDALFFVFLYIYGYSVRNMILIYNQYYIYFNYEGNVKINQGCVNLTLPAPSSLLRRKLWRYEFYHIKLLARRAYLMCCWGTIKWPKRVLYGWLAGCWPNLKETIPK